MRWPKHPRCSHACHWLCPLPDDNHVLQCRLRVLVITRRRHTDSTQLVLPELREQYSRLLLIHHQRGNKLASCMHAHRPGLAESVVPGRISWRRDAIPTVWGPEGRHLYSMGFDSVLPEAGTSSRTHPQDVQERRVEDPPKSPCPYTSTRRHCLGLHVPWSRSRDAPAVRAWRLRKVLRLVRAATDVVSPAAALRPSAPAKAPLSALYPSPSAIRSLRRFVGGLISKYVPVSSNLISSTRAQSALDIQHYRHSMPFLSRTISSTHPRSLHIHPTPLVHRPSSIVLLARTYMHRQCAFRFASTNDLGLLAALTALQSRKHTF